MQNAATHFPVNFGSSGFCTMSDVKFINSEPNI